MNHWLYQSSNRIPYDVSVFDNQVPWGLKAKGIFRDYVNGVAPFHPNYESSTFDVGQPNLERFRLSKVNHGEDAPVEFTRALPVDVIWGKALERPTRLTSVKNIETFRRACDYYLRYDTLGEALKACYSMNTEDQLTVNAARCITGVVRKFIWDGCIFGRTITGYLGWFPEGTIVGDSVYVVHGSKMPLVLRPS